MIMELPCAIIHTVIFLSRFIAVSGSDFDDDFEEAQESHNAFKNLVNWVGIVVGISVFIIVVLCIVIVCCCCKRRQGNRGHVYRQPVNQQQVVIQQTQYSPNIQPQGYPPQQNIAPPMGYTTTGGGTGYPPGGAVPGYSPAGYPPAGYQDNKLQPSAPPPPAPYGMEPPPPYPGT